MLCWINKVVIVTDCSDNIGFAIMDKLAKAGMIVIGFTKNQNILEEITKRLSAMANANGKIALFECNIADVEQMIEVFQKIKDTYEGVDVLINNAQYNIDCLVSNGATEDIKNFIDININALITCIRLAAGSMIERKTRGHIINMNDIISYQIPKDSRKSIYIATKATVTSINEILRHEFRFLKANIKVTNIACGRIEGKTEMETIDPKLQVKDVAKLVKLILATPEHLQVHEIMLDSVVE
ncbi:dehydrogenase/reductase SDR family member 11-like [Spodoptera litura]|uniref:Dehydrogenase/reductase SDR family member 11-like n=1 Tax=Spodoptera litura TaxID=69820 RepID=A0A9J7DP65_SPOLT|nr:dehydrogenase/reductase SDR family member 11-like [Spodoptera litura]